MVATRLLVCGRVDGAASVDVAQGSTEFWAPQGRLVRTATEANVQWRARDDFTLSSLFVRVLFNNTDADSVFHSRVNAADGNQLVTFGAGVSGTQEDTTNTDTLTAAGAQLFNSDVDAGSGSHGDVITPSIISYLLADSNGGNVSLVGAGVGNIEQDGSVTAFYHLSGFLFPLVTEAHAQYRIRVAATFDEMRVFAVVNSLDNNSTLSLSDDGVDTSVTLTIVAKTTGEVEDTTNSATPASGSLMNYTCVSGATNMASEGLTIGNLHIAMESDGRFIGQGVALGGIPSNVTHYNALNSHLTVLSATELDAQMDARVDFIAQNGFSFASANTCDAQTDVRLRKNTGNSSILMSFAATTSGEVEDTTNTELYVPADVVNWLHDTSASTAGDVFSLETAGFEMLSVDDMPWDRNPQGIHRVTTMRAY